MKILFTKMHGLGNDFMVIDGIHQSITPDPKLIAAWADRHFGIGFDQLLLVEPPSNAEALFKYRILMLMVVKWINAATERVALLVLYVKKVLLMPR